MDGPKCKTPMHKGLTNTVSEYNLRYFTNWHSERCGHMISSQYDVNICISTDFNHTFIILLELAHFQ
jgi:hypothetical protein